MNTTLEISSINTAIPHVIPSDLFSGTNYTVSTLTGDVEGADTDANVYITLYGEKGDSGFRKLDNKHFARGK